MIRKIDSTKHRNINLSYILSAISNLTFWYGPWLLYFLNYVTLAQVAIIEVIGVVTSIVLEVPTGAAADLLGKKKALILAFLFTGLGELMQIISPGFKQFMFAYFLLNVGYSFYSGTMDAFIFDTLKSHKAEDEYPRVLSRQQSIINGALASASVIGGFLYKIWIGLPFLATACVKLIGIVVTLFTTEPKVDTETYSFRNFANQTKVGFKQLFSPQMMRVSILLVTMGALYTFAYELLDDFTVVNMGYGPVGIGILYSASIFLAIPSSLLYERIQKKYKPYLLAAFGGIVIAMNFIFTPWINVYVWTGLFIGRVLYSPIRKAAVTQIINENTPSKIRATTLSTYELLRKVPYVFMAGQVGALVDQIGLKRVVFWYAVLMLLVVLPQIVSYLRNSKGRRPLEMNY